MYGVLDEMRAEFGKVNASGTANATADTTIKNMKLYKR